MDVWTIQKREIMEMVKTGIVWYPELKKGSCPGLSLCYELAIGICNHHNKSSARGLVFAMARNAAEPFQDADEIGKLLKSNKRLEGFLRTEKGSLLEDGYDLVRLQYPDHINPVPVDVCAYTAMEPFIVKEDDGGLSFDLYAADPAGLTSAEQMFPFFKDWVIGWPASPMFRNHSTFFQLHYGFIAPENLTGEEYPATILICKEET